MASACDNCAKSIGFFTRKKVKMPDGATSVVCRTCAKDLLARMASESQSAARSASSTAGDQAREGAGAGLNIPRRFRGEGAAGASEGSQDGAHPYREAPASSPLQDQLDECRQQLRADGRQVGPYRELYRLQLREEIFDGAWCAASVLCFLDEANDEERSFFEDWRPRDLPAFSGRIDNEAWWEHLFHEDEDWFVGKIYESVAVAGLKAKIEALEAKDELPILPEKYRLDPATSTVVFGRVFHLAGQVLGITPPALYGRSDVPGGLVVVPAESPGSIAGAGVMEGRTAPELAFMVGRHLTMYRGEHYIKALFPTATELGVLLAAAMQIAAPDAPVPSEIAAQAKATALALVKHMQPIQLERLRVIARMHQKRERSVDIKRWAQLVETTAARAGLLLCADLTVAQRLMASEAQIPGDLPVGERLEDLMRFVVSDSYSFLRSTLGISVRGDLGGGSG